VSTDGETQKPESVAPQAIEVVGDATPEQVAALVAVLSAVSGESVQTVEPRPTSQWSAPAGLVRRPLTPGPRSAGAWQRSLRP
jgi:hypothetical protein